MSSFATSESGFVAGGTSVSGSIRYGTSQLVGATIQAGTYTEAVSQVESLAQEGMGSGTGTQCNSCNCATTTPSATTPLSSQPNGTTGFYYSGLRRGAFTKSITSFQYPYFTNNTVCSTNGPSSTPKGDGTLIVGPGYQCIAMNFEYEAHTCQVTSQSGDPFTFTETVTTYDENGTYFAIRNTPCPLAPRLANSGFASVLDYKEDPLVNNRDFVCKPGADQITNLIAGIQTSQNGSQRTFSEEEVPISIFVPREIRVPLGAYFFIAIGETANRQLVDTNITSQVVSTAKPAALWVDRVVLEFNENAITDTRYFVATHEGTADLEVHAGGTTYDMKVTVVLPSSLGSTSTQFDGLISLAGSLNGIPPQIMKAIIQRETGGNFNPLSYRYEPLAYIGDYRYFSSVTGLPFSRGTNQRTAIPHSLYRFESGIGEVSPPVSAGSDLASVDVSLKNKLQIFRGGTQRAINSTDQLVTIQEIMEWNDSVFGNISNGPPFDQNWTDASNRANPVFVNAIVKNPGILNVTAQPLLSASFGILQMTYIRAIEEGWTGLKPVGRCDSFPQDCEPSGLVDTQMNIAAGGGSINIAGVALASSYLDKVGIRNTFQDMDEYELLWKRPAMDGYNKKVGYAKEVMENFVPMFLPKSQSSIIQSFNRRSR